VGKEVGGGGEEGGREVGVGGGHPPTLGTKERGQGGGPSHGHVASDAVVGNQL
jgi:hypothetical protein